jgi:uncharacterized membrane protein YuzA (DUF378 family)
MKILHTIAWILLIIGGLNWLLVVFGWELGANLFGGMDSIVSKIIYVLVGLSAIVELVTHKSICKSCYIAGGINPTIGPKV